MTATALATTALNTKGIHHAILKAVHDAGAEISVVTDEPLLFRLHMVTDDGELRAEGDDARALRALAQQWAEGENTEDYLVDDDSENADADDADDEGPHTVVKDAYKVFYKNQGHPNNNGDWLNTQLDKLTKNDEGELILTNLVAIFELNGIMDWQKYQKGNPRSDNGQIRMNGGNRLRAIVRKTGVLKVPGEDIKVPASFLKAKTEG